MDYKNLTAPCGRDCFNCPFYLSATNEQLKLTMSERLTCKPEEIPCAGCRNNNGKCNSLRLYGFSGNCKVHTCAAEKKVEFCFECDEFPCILLHPLADRSDKFPHNMKVFNLCKIKRMGIEEWGKEQALTSFKYYYSGKLDSCF